MGGVLAGQFRVSGDEFPIRVRLRPEDRLTSLDLDDIGVRTPAGEIIPVSAITRLEKSRGPTRISRINGQRVTYVTANLEQDVALGDAVNAIRDDLAQMPMPDGFSVVFGGEYEEQEKAQKDFMLAIIMALVLIYMVMAGQFERFLDPPYRDVLGTACHRWCCAYCLSDRRYDQHAERHGTCHAHRYRGK